MNKTKTILAFNWKMNPQTFREAHALLAHLKTQIARTKNVEIICAVPSVYIAPLQKELGRSKKISLAGQYIYHEEAGAFTGAVSVGMLLDFGVNTTLVGHSERRALFAVTDEMVNKKILAMTSNGGNVILCLGESDRDENGAYLKVLEQQIKIALKGLPSKDLSKVTIAYEPIWAIGSRAKRSVTADELFSSVLLVRKIVGKLYDQAKAKKMSVLYGGSVSSKNIHELLAVPGVSGFLVGRASLSKAELTTLVKASENKQLLLGKVYTKT